MNTNMEKSAISPYDLVWKSLFVKSLDSFRSTRFSDEQIRDKLTIHFQNRKLSHGGDVKEVIYPLTSAKGCAIVVFEDEKDLASVVKLEQIFYGQLLKVDELPPIFSSVRAEIHPFYFKIMPTDIYDKISERFEMVAGVTVDRSNYSQIACSMPSQLDRVGEEVVRLAVGKVGQSLSNTNGEFEAAGASGAEYNTDMAFQRDHKETYPEARDPEDAERRMSVSEEEPERFSVEMRDLEVHENQRSRERTTCPKTSDDNEESTTSSVEDVQTNQQMQEQDIISLDKNVYKYIQAFDGPAVDKFLPNLRMKVRESKSQENLEAVILPSRAGVSVEDIKKARDDFIEFYQKAFYKISRKTIDCSKITKREMEDAAKKTQHDFKKDTLILPVDGSPVACLILTRGNVEEVARKFRGYAGIKSGKSLRAGAARDVSPASQDVPTTGSQFKKEVPENHHPAEEQQQQVPKGGVPDDHPWDFVTDEGISVYILQEDITIKCRASAVVIPTQPDLSLPMGGVARAVWSAAGPSLQNQCRSIMAARQWLQTAECVVMPAFNLNNMYHSVIHAVIPNGPSNNFLPDLYATFLNCLRTAATYRLSSLAIPLMGSGLSKAPKRECADVLVWAILNFSRETRQLQIVKEVLLVNNDFDSAAALQQSLQYSLGSPTGVPDCQSEANYENRSDLYNAKNWPNLPQSEASKVTMVSHPQSRHDVSSVQGGASGQPMGATVWFHSKHAAIVTSRSIVAPASKWPDTKNPNGVGDQPVTSQPRSNSGTVGGEGKGQPKKETTGQAAVASDKSYGNQQANQGSDAGKGNSTTEADLQGADQAKASDNKLDECPICLNAMEDVHVLPKCKHAFCKSCIKKSFETNGNRCPVCRTPCGEPKGNQPDGTMKSYTSSFLHLPGYLHCGIITINYNIPSGMQSANHPNPGKYFQGDRRTAYLPDNAEGREVLTLLRKAFDARLVFTVGLSVTSGADNVVTWNDIHHKTSQDGGPQNYGYPDPDYLRRVKQDIAAKGIV